MFKGLQDKHNMHTDFYNVFSNKQRRPMKDVYITEQKTEMDDCMNGTDLLNQ